MRTCASAGTYLRVADPDWEDPLDGAVSMTRGGRWNAPGGYRAVYLNADLATARANTRLLIEEAIQGMPFAFHDLEPCALPVLIEVDLPSGDILDARTDRGLMSAGLPTTYPRSEAGDPLPLQDCQRVGTRAHRAGVSRIAYRSAANAAGGGEVAWLEDHGGPLAASGPVRTFEEWFWDQAGTGSSS